jgi:hypothetical protein
MADYDTCGTWSVGKTGLGMAGRSLDDSGRLGPDSLASRILPEAEGKVVMNIIGLVRTRGSEYALCCHDRRKNRQEMAEAG